MEYIASVSWSDQCMKYTRVLTRGHQKDPHSDMILVHDDDLAHFIEVSPLGVSELPHASFIRPFMFLVPRNPPAG